MKKLLFLLPFLLTLGVGVGVLQALVYTDFYGNSVDLPAGAVSFADSVVSYNPVVKNGEPTMPHRDPSDALGVLDYEGVNSCPQDGCTFVSLGDGGTITLEFTDNSLTGSGDNKWDLWIFEVGPDVEDTFVAISKDNVVWHNVGKVFGNTAGIDIDAFGFGPGDFFSFVRLTDDPDEGSSTGITVGADIDAVAAISSAAAVCEGDFDNDSDVDGTDLAVFAADFGRTNCATGAPCEGDFDKDNDVDGSDLAVFAGDFGRTDCP